MIPYNKVKIVNSNYFYDEYNMVDEDIELLQQMVDEGNDQYDLDLFIDEYIGNAINQYNDVVVEYLNDVYSGPMRLSDVNNLTRNISLLTFGLSAFLIKQFSTYANKIYLPEVFKQNNLTDAELIKNVSREVISEFERVIDGTFSQTQGFILNGIRSIQREMITENLLLKRSGIKGDALEQEINSFKNSLKTKYPDIYEAFKHGKILQISKFVDGKEVTRHYKLDYYVDLSIRTTLLNADRISTTIAALVDEEEVVEYYLSDPRNVVKDREICQHILNNKVNGVSILALNDDAAKKYGVMTVDEAQSTPDYAMGPYCRHSLRRCKKEYLEELQNVGN
jgi:hypothetical protein